MYACVHACFCRARGWGSNRGHWALHDKQRVCVGDGTPPSWTSVSPSVREGAGWKPPGNPRFPGLKLTLQVAGGLPEDTCCHLVEETCMAPLPTSAY